MPTKSAAALLTLASVLAVVPAAPALAHDIYHWTDQKQQRCAYDPFAGRQCWTETVRVKVPSHHSHAQVCPTGTTGTYPDCYPIPPANDATPTVPENDWTDPKDDGDGDQGGGTDGDQTDDPDPDPEPTTTTTPPTTTQPPVCTWPNHAHGSTCHGPHVPPCGTGTWSPGHGHAPVQRPPCPTTPPATTAAPTTAPPDCDSTEHRHALGARRNRGGATTSACHDASASHCAGNMHEHVHGSQECHKVDSGGGSGWSSHQCPAGQHQHEHNASPCHSRRIAHCDGDGQHAHELTTPSGLDMSHWCHPASALHCGAREHYHDGLGCHSVSADNCPAGQHEHVATVRLGCHDPSIVHHSSGPTELAIGVLDLALCGPLLALPKGFSALADGCSALLEQLRKDAQELADKKNQEHDETTTTEGPPPPTTQPSTTEAPKKITWDDVYKKRDEWLAGKATQREVNEMLDRLLCQNGVTERCQ